MTGQDLDRLFAGLNLKPDPDAKQKAKERMLATAPRGKAETTILREEKKMQTEQDNKTTVAEKTATTQSPPEKNGAPGPAPQKEKFRFGKNFWQGTGLGAGIAAILIGVLLAVPATNDLLMGTMAGEPDVLLPDLPDFVAVQPEVNEDIELMEGEEAPEGPGAVLTIFRGEEEDLTIPSELDGMNITTIGDELFFGDETLQTVTISDGVEAIDELAFANASNLESVTIPPSVDSIAPNAFDGTAENFTIIGEAGTPAEEFAAQNGIRFNGEMLPLAEPDDVPGELDDPDALSPEETYPPEMPQENNEEDAA